MEFNLYTYKATIVDAYDGDTVTSVTDLGFDISFKMKLRLSDIDTPEIRGEERPQGLIVKDIVEKLVVGKQVHIQTEKDRTGKYGRYLATIFLEDGTSLNAWLLEENLAVPYK